MKTRYLEIALILATLLVAPAAAAADTPATPVEQVTNFTQNAVLSRAGELTIDQQIDYDYAGARLHDISYNIPVSYHDDQGRDYRMSFKLIEASADGAPLQLSPKITPQFVYMVLPAGTSAAPTRHFTLRYTLAPMVIAADQADAMRLVVVGRDWTVPINQVNFQIKTPVAPNDVICSTGTASSNTSNCNTNQNGTNTSVATGEPLAPGNSFSIYLAFGHKNFTTYLQAYQAPSGWIGLGTIAAAMLVVIVIVVVLVVRFGRRRPIVRPPASEYTKANDSSENQAQRD